MSTPVTLGNWLETRLTALIQAKDEDSFDAAFDTLYSPKLSTVTYNGKSIAKEDYKEQLKIIYVTGAKLSAEVTFQDVVEVPNETTDETKVSLNFSFVATSGWTATSALGRGASWQCISPFL